MSWTAVEVKKNVYVGLSCGRWFLRCFDMVVAVEGDPCRDDAIVDRFWTEGNLRLACDRIVNNLLCSVSPPKFTVGAETEWERKQYDINSTIKALQDMVQRADPSVEPMESLPGVCSQISNVLAGQAKDIKELSGYKHQAENFRLALEDSDSELKRLLSLINTPEVEEFDKAIPLEAAHQVERWGVAHDEGKGPEDWFWLLGYLSGKALRSAIAEDYAKAKHHCISSAAVLRNWHAHLRSGKSHMRPGIKSPDDGES